MLLSLVGVVCGLALILAAKAVLRLSHQGELSLRSVAAFMVGVSGAWLLARSLGQDADLTWNDVFLPVGVTGWIVQAAWRRRGAQMRRATDWAELDDREVDHA